jgi:hypothetical protein
VGVALNGFHRRRCTSRLRSTLVCTAFLMLGACSSPSSPSSAESTLPAQGSGGSVLPGESINDAYQRLITACMDPYGFPYTVTNIIADNVPQTFRVYEGDPVVQARVRECMARAAQGAGIRKLSASELEANWKFQSALWACLAGKGYDVGTPVSLEAYIAAGGVIDAASKASDFGGSDQPGADADMQACVAEVG